MRPGSGPLVREAKIAASSEESGIPDMLPRRTRHPIRRGAPMQDATADILTLHRMARPPDRLHPIEASALHARRERVFLVLAGVFLGAMAMLNILGITKFIHFGPLALAVGVLPYPLTFLCTDFISELYGRKRANFVVFVGLLVNLLVLAFIWAGDRAEPIEFRSDVQRIVTMDYIDLRTDGDMPLINPNSGTAYVRPAVRDEAGRLRAVERFELARVPGGDDDAYELIDADSGLPIIREEMLFDRIATTTRQAVLASMIAYLFAQFIDVWIFHFWKRLTRGKHLWLRNNGSTVISQLVDTTCVVLITFWASIAAGDLAGKQVMALIGGAYLFKLCVALLDTIPFYIGVGVLSRYLRIDPAAEHDADRETSAPQSG